MTITMRYKEPEHYPACVSGVMASLGNGEAGKYMTVNEAKEV